MHQRPLELDAAVCPDRERHGRVGLQSHAEAQAVEENAGDVRPFVLTRRFLFDD